MPQYFNKDTLKVNQSYRALRRAVGILGLALPILLIIGNGGVEGAISFYYYTKMSTVFTGILIAFALILITYRGDAPQSSGLSENRMTHWAGFFALLVALIPTKFGMEIESLFYSHNDPIRGIIHDLSAVLFIFLMGLVVLTKFSKAPYFGKQYRNLGIVVMVSLGFTVLAYLYKRFTGQQLFDGAVFWGEAFALWAFGFAWLRRGVPRMKDFWTFK